MHGLQHRITVPVASACTTQAGDQQWTTIRYEDFLLIASAVPETIFDAQSHRFWVLHKSGKVVGEFAPAYACHEDYSYRTEYVLKDGTLLEFAGRCNDVAAERLCTWKVAVVCDVSAELPPTDARVTAFRRAYKG